MQTITKRQAADILDVTPSAVQRMIDRGELRSIPVTDGERIILHRLRLADVEKLRDRRVAA